MQSLPITINCGTMCLRVYQCLVAGHDQLFSRVPGFPSSIIVAFMHGIAELLLKVVKHTNNCINKNVDI